MNSITVFSRSNNDILFDMMRGFLPENISIQKIEDKNDWKDASTYLYHIIDTCETKYAINIDIDCFVFNWAAVIEMVEFMRQNGMMYSGMPDGGVHPGRSHAWTTMNPFFNIFDVERIRFFKDNEGLTWDQIEKHGYLPAWDAKKPDFITGPCNYDNREPFHGFFNWLYSCADCLMHPARVSENHLDTYLVDIYGKDFCIHAWYSRQYNSDAATKYRIDYLYAVSKEYYEKINEANSNSPIS